MNTATSDEFVGVRSVSWEHGQRHETHQQVLTSELADALERWDEAPFEWIADHQSEIPRPIRVVPFFFSGTDPSEQEEPLRETAAPAKSSSLVEHPLPDLLGLSKWNVRTPHGLSERVKEIGADEHLIGTILPVRSVGIIVGDSGLGKSPLAYQMAVSIAGGVPFLGYPVKQAPVLYVDFENGLAQVQNIVERMATFQGLNMKDIENSLGLWNVNDAPTLWGQAGYGLLDLIRDVRPGIVFIDSLGSWFPDIEEKNAIANRLLGSLREVAGKIGASVVGIHHLRKPSTDPAIAPKSLEQEEPRRWFLQARGPRAIVNSSDVRIGVDKPSSNTSKKRDAQTEVALVMGGFGRVNGNLPLTYLGRVLDEEGEPIGYRRLTGPALLFNLEHEQAFKKLPPSFRFKDAQMALDKGPQATTEFLNKAAGVGILRKVSRGQYEKTPEEKGIAD